MKKAVIYARFSSDKQTEDSIEAQVRACREYAAAHQLDVVDVYADEAVSGKGSKTALRAKYQKLLRDAAKGAFSVILIHKYDRIARNLGEHVNLEAKLKELDVELVAVAQNFGNTNEAKIMRALVWSMSEYYLDNLAGETKKGLREAALKGFHTGGYPPFGYDVVGPERQRHYAVNELEAAYVRKLFAAAQAREGFQALIAEMAAAGITGKRGRPIKYPQIYEILRNEKYTGTFIYSPSEEKCRGARRTKPNAIRVEHAFPAIITKKQFEAVQKIMNERKQSGRRANYLCSGLVYCRCGAKMHGMVSRRKGHEYPYFICSAKCGAPAVHMEDVDKAALDYLHTLLAPGSQERIAASLRQYQADHQEVAKDFSRAIQRRLAQKRKEYDALLHNLSSAALPAAVVQDIGARMETLQAEIAALEQTPPDQDFTTDQIKTWLTSLRESPDHQAIKLLIERIDAHYDPKQEKTAFSMQSTLNAVLSKSGCGGQI